MINHSVPPSLETPNDYASIRAADEFYGSKAIFLSYFNIPRRKSGHLTTGLKAVLPFHQTAIMGRVRCSAPRMAIV
ncbi:MAG: hypothetical protein ACJ8M1_01835 [Chthoniobacterales bacterium]